MLDVFAYIKGISLMPDNFLTRSRLLSHGALLLSIAKYGKVYRSLTILINSVYYAQLALFCDFLAPEAARKLLYLATVEIKRKWTRPIWNWPQVLNQLGIRSEDRIDF